MRRREEDDVDVWCTDWARPRRIALGIIDGKMIEPKERLGKLRCTLAEVREEGAAGHSAASRMMNELGKINQNWPEVRTGMALLVHIAYQVMPCREREVMHVHYVWRELKIKDKCQALGINEPAYFVTLKSLKSFIRGSVLTQQPTRATA